MELVRITQAASYYLVGMDFYGDPFGRASAWEEENEIGRLFKRFEDFYAPNPVQIKGNLFPQAVFEGHFVSDATRRTGDFDVFVGVLVGELADLPLECVARQLPFTQYAVMTITGEKITSDWHMAIQEQWPPGPEYLLAFDYSLTCYDQRFHGMERLEESAVDVYIPVRRR